jgi:hypothetical protein
MIGRTLKEDMSVAELAENFVSITLGQFQAERHDEFAKYKRLYQEMIAVEQELKTRPGDQRRSLVTLFEHPNPQVRLMAAEATLALVPTAARQVLQELWDRKQFPQAAHAMGTLRALERGDRKPT